MKHRSRLEREQKEDEEKRGLEKLIAQETARLTIINARLKSIADGTGGEGAEFEDTEALQYEADEIQQKLKTQRERIAAIDFKRSWSVDEICKVKSEKSIVNDAKVTSLKAEDYKPSGATANVVQKKAADTLPTPPSTSASTPPLAVKSDASTNISTTTHTENVIAGPVEEVLGNGVTAAQRDRLAVMSYNDFAIEHEDVHE